MVKTNIMLTADSANSAVDYYYFQYLINWLFLFLQSGQELLCKTDAGFLPVGCTSWHQPKVSKHC